MKLKKDLAGALIDAIVAFEDDTNGLFDVTGIEVVHGGMGSWQIEITCTNGRNVDTVSRFVGGVDYVGAVWVEQE